MQSESFAPLIAVNVVSIVLRFASARWPRLTRLLFTLILSVLTGLFAFGDLALRRFRPNPAMWQALAAIFVTVVAVGLLTYVPFLGVIIVLGSWLLGIGALSSGAWMALHNYGTDEIQQS